MNCLDCNSSLGSLHKWGCNYITAHCEDCRYEIVLLEHCGLDSGRSTRKAKEAVEVEG